jgi:lysophospholipase L1-like esterase
MKHLLPLASVCLLIVLNAARGQEPNAPAVVDPDRFEADIRKFEQADLASPPPVGANLFVGSSSIRRWKLDASFPNFTCINRGFGGSEMSDSAKYVERIVIPARPKVVVLYAGDNDIAKKKTPTTVRDDYRVFRDTLHKALPATKIVVIGLKPSPSRWKLREEAQEANRLLQIETKEGQNQVFVDVWAAMLDDAGLPREDLYVEDKLHLSDAGYKIWNDLLTPHLTLKLALQANARQFVLFDATFTFTKEAADNSKPSPSHYYVRDKLMNADRPKDWTAPVDYRNGTAHVRLEVLEKPAGGEATTWSVCYIPHKGQKNGYGCFNTPVYKEAGVYELDIPMTKFWQNDSIVWEQGIKEMHLVIKDNSGGSGHAHKRQDHEKFFPTKVRMTVIQVAADSKYDASLVPNLSPAKLNVASPAKSENAAKPATGNPK